MAGITSAGAASGMDFESVIAASVAQKKRSLNRGLVVRKETANIEISGISSMKEALKSFQDSIKALTKEEAFNARKVVSDQPTDKPYFSIKTDEAASNMNMDIAVTQLASSTRLNKKFVSGPDFNNSFQEGTLTIKYKPNVEGETDKDGKPIEAKEQEFKIEVNEGDSLEVIRKKLNENNLGFSVSLIKGKDGYELGIDTGKTGAKSGSFSIEASGKDGAPLASTGGTKFDSLDKLNVKISDDSKTNNENGFSIKQGTDASIFVNGEQLTSKTNTFKDMISGVTITANALSKELTDKDTGANSIEIDGKKYITNTANIEQDPDGVAKKVEDFVKAYNTLNSKLDGLYKHNTYKDGKNNYDGGDLAGDPMVRAIQSSLTSTISNFVGEGKEGGMSIFDMGIKLEKDGTMKFEKDDFTKNLKDNYNTVVNMFTKDDEKNPGLFKKMNSFLDDYTKSAGILDQRKDNAQTDVKYYEAKEEANKEYLAKYEESLRAKYGKLDARISGYNQQLANMQSMLSGLMMPM